MAYRMHLQVSYEEAEIEKLQQSKQKWKGEMGKAEEADTERGHKEP